MDKIVRVVLVRVDGSPLLADVEFEEPRPYGCRTIGFRSPLERASQYEPPAVVSRLGPSSGFYDEEAEGCWLEVAGQEEEEDGP